jgi:hypothetical protein
VQANPPLAHLCFSPQSKLPTACCLSISCDSRKKQQPFSAAIQAVVAAPLSRMSVHQKKPSPCMLTQVHTSTNLLATSLHQQQVNPLFSSCIRVAFTWMPLWHFGKQPACRPNFFRLWLNLHKLRMNSHVLPCSLQPQYLVEMLVGLRPKLCWCALTQVRAS